MFSFLRGSAADEEGVKAAHNRGSLGLSMRLTAANLRVVFAFPCDVSGCLLRVRDTYHCVVVVLVVDVIVAIVDVTLVPVVADFKISGGEWRRASQLRVLIPFRCLPHLHPNLTASRDQKLPCSLSNVVLLAPPLWFTTLHPLRQSRASGTQAARPVRPPRLALSLSPSASSHTSTTASYAQHCTPCLHHRSTRRRPHRATCRLRTPSGLATPARLPSLLRRLAVTGRTRRARSGKSQRVPSAQRAARATRVIAAL